MNMKTRELRYKGTVHLPMQLFESSIIKPPLQSQKKLPIVFMHLELIISLQAEVVLHSSTSVLIEINDTIHK